mgnify:CR=1 FL=1
MINPQRLVVLQAVVASGSIHAAARNLNYSPATISQHMSALSRETGLVLFEKAGRGIVPTVAAISLSNDASTVLASMRRLDRTIDDLHKGPTATDLRAFIPARDFALIRETSSRRRCWNWRSTPLSISPVSERLRTG